MGRLVKHAFAERCRGRLAFAGGKISYYIDQTTRKPGRDGMKNNEPGQSYSVAF